MPPAPAPPRLLTLLLLLLGLCLSSVVRGFVVAPPGPCDRRRAAMPRMQQQQGQPAAAEPKRVLVVGGTGRVGGSTVRALKALGLGGDSKRGLQALLPPLAVSVGGRSPENFEKAKARWAALGAKQGLDAGAFEDVGFVSLDHEDPTSLVEALRAAKPDLIVHTAGTFLPELYSFMHGVERSVMSMTVHTYTHTYITRIPGPFQRRKAPEVLKAALQLRTPYVDVCDDIDLSQVAKGYHEEAKRAGVPMLISTGVWPGISSLMAVDVAEALGGPAETDSIDFQFYTAGSGGAGTTILRSGLLSLYWGALKASMGQFNYDLTLYPAFTPFHTQRHFPDPLGKRARLCQRAGAPLRPGLRLSHRRLRTRRGAAPDLSDEFARSLQLLPMPWRSQLRHLLRDGARLLELPLEGHDLPAQGPAAGPRGDAGARARLGAARPGRRHAGALVFWGGWGLSSRSV